jgi:hypothetical protein
MVKVQTTSNLSSGHSDGGVGVTEGNAAAMAGISPCCHHEINAGPDCAMTCSTSASSSPLPKLVSTGMPSWAASGVTVSRVRVPSASSLAPAA